MALEDFTTYTEVDPSGDLTVAANDITISTMAANVDARVSKDFGASHFGQFDHTFKFSYSARAAGSQMTPYAVKAADGGGSTTGSTDLELIYVGYSSFVELYFQFGGGIDQDVYASLAISTDYWARVERTASVTQVRIYSDSGLTTLVDTMSVTFDSTALRWMVLASADWSGTVTMSGMVEDLDLNEGAGPTGNPWYYYAQQ